MSNERKYCITEEGLSASTTLLSAEDIELLRSKMPDENWQTKVNEGRTKLFSTIEDAALMRALCRTSPDATYTESQARPVFAWAEKIRIGQILLEMVLKGMLSISVRTDGELEFSAVPAEVILAEWEKHQKSFSKQ